MGWGLGYGIFWWFFGPLTGCRFWPEQVSIGLQTEAPRCSVQLSATFSRADPRLAYATVDRLWVQLIIQSDPLNREPEGPGLRLFRSLRWGAFAGLTGGLVASPHPHCRWRPLVGSRPRHSSFRLSGFFVHLFVSAAIGMTYGLLFRNEASTLGLGVMWGWLFGLIWWYIGPMTLLPLLLTGECDWRASAASALLPSLTGHLIFGATTALIFLVLERRYTRLLFSDPRIAARELQTNPPRWNARTCLVASHAWAGGLTAYSLWGDANCRQMGSGDWRSNRCR